MKYLLNAIIALSTMGLTGCLNMYEPPKTNQTRIEVRESTFMEYVAYDNIDDAYIEKLARHYNRYAATPMDIIVTYDPHANKNGAMHASAHMADLANKLRAQGVEGIKTGVMPVQGQGHDHQVLVNYDYMNAHAPAGCDSGLMDVDVGMDKKGVDDDRDYRFGCSVDSMIAKQIAKPKHLLGRDNVDTKTDGRAPTNIIDGYRTGAPNEELRGDNASES